MSYPQLIALSGYPQAVALLSEYDKRFMTLSTMFDATDTDAQELVNDWTPWLSQLPQDGSSSHAVLVELFACHLSLQGTLHSKFNTAYKAIRIKDRPNIVIGKDGDLGLQVRGWVKTVAELASITESSNRELVGSVGNFFEENKVLILETYQGIDGVNQFYEDVKGSLLEPYSGVIFAQVFDDDIKSWIEKCKSSNGLRSTEYPGVIFDQVDPDTFYIKDFWNRFTSAVLDLSSRCGTGLSEFNPLFNGFRNFGMTEYMHNQAATHPELDEMLAALSGLLSFRDALAFCSQEKALSIFTEIAKSRIPQIDRRIAGKLEKLFTVAQEVVADARRFGVELHRYDLRGMNSPLHPLAASGRQRDLRTIDKRNSDIANDGRHLTEISEVLNAEFPGRANKDLRSAAANLLVDVYDPAISMDAERHSAFVGQVREMFAGFAKTPEMVRESIS